MTSPLSGDRPILTSLDPMGTSFSMECSNFSVSFGIATPSFKITRFANSISRSDPYRSPESLAAVFEPAAEEPDSRESGNARGRLAQHNDGDGVAASRSIRRIHETIGSFLRVAGVFQNRRNLRV